MKLSTKSRYAVMAMVDLAQRSTGQPVALADIAERQDISLSYLEQLFAKLRRGGVVRSIRGPGGGYTLGKAAERIRIADIVLAVDAPAKARRHMSLAYDGNQARSSTDDLWDALGNQIFGFLNSITVADVCERRISGTRQPVWSTDSRSAIA
jgi:Rrf2 family iron-sulfur cluster assembly transcriptional regulator